MAYFKNTSTFLTFMNNFKKFWDKFWFTVWKDPSLKGWIMSIIFIFIVIKFIFFPLLSFTTGTSLPLAIVESCSMYHEDNIFSDFDSWWEENGKEYRDFGISQEDFLEYNLNNGFTKGDILFITGVSPEKVELGDIIIFQAAGKDIIHRVVEINREESEYVFTTMGDNVGRVQFFEERISENQLVGKAQARLVPYAGWIKLVFYEPARESSQRGFC